MWQGTTGEEDAERCRRRWVEWITEHPHPETELARLFTLVTALVGAVEGRVEHVRNGLCPDADQPHSRDPDCLVCEMLVETMRGNEKRWGQV